MSVAYDLEARLEELRCSFVSSLPEQLGRFGASLERLRATSDAAVAEIERARLREIAHRLAGNGSLYGMPELSAWGKSTERLCRAAAPLDELTAAHRVFAQLLEP